MENFNLSQEIKSMPCGYAEKSVLDLKKEGWEEAWSFHQRFADQWNDACGRVEDIQRSGDWEAVLVYGQSEEEKRDGVAYIYKRKTQQRIKWEEEKGYA